MDISRISSNQPSYSSEFNQSVDLFEKSFQAMQHSKLDEQRKQYEEVMRESLKTMQESANAMLNQHLLSLKDNLAQDLSTYLKEPTPDHKEQVQSDIDLLKRG